MKRSRNGNNPNSDCRCAVRRPSTIPLVVLLSMLVSLSACRSSEPTSSLGQTGRRASRNDPSVRSVIAVYDQKPWINVDAAGDRDPEGIEFRIFLDAGNGRGVLRDGTLHAEMYKVVNDDAGQQVRTLVSDWHYPTAEIPTIAHTGMLGNGYFLRLRWATKDLCGNEIEVITRFESPDGHSVRSGTKRLRIPKYGS